MLNLSNQTDRENLEEFIANDIDEFCADYYEQGHRDHLGASTLGEECWRKLLYGFRWAKVERFDGRMMRLFNVGHSAEPRFVTYLKGIGFDVKEFNEDGKQFRVTGALGHYGGSLDGMCKAPERYQLSENIILSLSFKTNNTGAGFEKVNKEALQKAKPMHWAQECQYGYKTGIRYCIYMIENKNDSDLIIKVLELDWNYGAQLEKKAEQIIFSKEPPPRISENPSIFNCKYCHLKDICHNGEKPEKNCRSCRHSEPVENAEWKCNLHQDIIPKDFIKQGCEQWLPI
jgi:hypothetical protein